MAERRMFAKTIIDSDAFLDMPQSSQLLYFHLAMRADDDGFINNPKSITRNVKCNDDDLTLLAAKKFIIPFQSGIVVIKHWKIHNYIRSDRYKPTKYLEELAILSTDENCSYTLNQLKKVETGIPSVNQTETNGIPVVDKMDTQVRVGKGRLGNKHIGDFQEIIISYTTNEQLIEALNAFILMRKGIKKPLSERAINMLLKKLSELCKEDDELKIKLIDQSIFHNWQDVFPLKEDGIKPEQTNKPLSMAEMQKAALELARQKEGRK